MKAREFEAISECPRCGVIAYHWMKEPNRPPIPEIIDETAVFDWSGEILKKTTDKTYPAGTKQEDIDWNTGNCKVVRTCKNCDHGWGEK